MQEHRFFLTFSFIHIQTLHAHYIDKNKTQDRETGGSSCTWCGITRRIRATGSCTRRWRASSTVAVAWTL